MSNSGEWVHDEVAVKEIIRNGFFDLYTTSHVFFAFNISTGSAWQAWLSDSINGDVSKDEIKVSLWSLKTFKAPGPDGLHVGFISGSSW